ncbi:hypothetical protein ACET3Z_018965 [Daucus carota]
MRNSLIRGLICISRLKVSSHLQTLALDLFRAARAFDLLLVFLFPAMYGRAALQVEDLPKDKDPQLRAAWVFKGYLLICCSFKAAGKFYGLEAGELMSI